MDIEEISGPKVPDVLHQSETSDEALPVEEKERLSMIKEKSSIYYDLWKIKDMVTISAEARRKYEEMSAVNKSL